MFGSSLGNGVEKSVEPPDPTFADEFTVPQEYAVLIFDVRRAAVSLLFQVHRPKVLVQVDLIAFSSTFFEFADKVPEEAQHGSLVNLPKLFPAILTAFRRLLLWGFCA